MEFSHHGGEVYDLATVFDEGEEFLGDLESAVVVYFEGFFDYSVIYS